MRGMVDTTVAGGGAATSSIAGVVTTSWAGVVREAIVEAFVIALCARIN